jgi:hypothetical protein
MKLSEVIKFLKERMELFQDFPYPRLKDLAEGSQLITFEPNEAVIRFGDEGRFLGIILDGEAEVSGSPAARRCLFRRISFPPLLSVTRLPSNIYRKCSQSA